MLARLIRISIFLFLTIGLQYNSAFASLQLSSFTQQENNDNSHASQLMAANPTLPTQVAPTPNGGTVCSDVANQIRTVSESKTSDQVYPWENLDWLKKNLGQPKFVQIRENKIYMWICINPSGGTSLIMHLVVDKMGVEHVLNQSMICKPQEPCSAYGFERNGNKITGLVVTPQELQ